jgi:hypothetical protein
VNLDRFVCSDYFWSLWAIFFISGNRTGYLLHEGLQKRGRERRSERLSAFMVFLKVVYLRIIRPAIDHATYIEYLCIAHRTYIHSATIRPWRKIWTLPNLKLEVLFPRASVVFQCLILPQNVWHLPLLRNSFSEANNLWKAVIVRRHSVAMSWRFPLFSSY